MKQSTNPATTQLWNSFKHTLYAFQVIVIALAIPLLTCLEMAHTDNTASNVKVKEAQANKNVIAETTNATINFSPLLASNY